MGTNSLDTLLYSCIDQPRCQGCIRTTLGQSSDSSILIGRQFFIPNSNELLKIAGMQTRSLHFDSSSTQTKHRKKFFGRCNYYFTTSHDSTMDNSREQSMIQPRPVRSFLRSTKQGFDISLRRIFSSCICLHGAAVCLWFGAKLARTSSEGSSVLQCRPT